MLCEISGKHFLISQLEAPGEQETAIPSHPGI
jgi:hypothetical protein